MSIYGNKITSVNPKTIPLPQGFNPERDLIGFSLIQPTDKLSINSQPNIWINPTYDFDISGIAIDFDVSIIALDFDKVNPSL